MHCIVLPWFIMVWYSLRVYSLDKKCPRLDMARCYSKHAKQYHLTVKRSFIPPPPRCRPPPPRQTSLPSHFRQSISGNECLSLQAECHTRWESEAGQKEELLKLYDKLKEENANLQDEIDDLMYPEDIPSNQQVRHNNCCLATSVFGRKLRITMKLVMILLHLLVMKIFKLS